MATGNNKPTIRQQGETWEDAAHRMFEAGHPDAWRIRMGRAEVPVNVRQAIMHWVRCQYISCSKARDRIALSRSTMTKDDWEIYNAKKYEYWKGLTSYFLKTLQEGIVSLSVDNHREAIQPINIADDQL